MTGKRFDLGPASILESRNGDITKGGLIRNGFTEQDGASEIWNNMRPALGTSVAAPFSGTGLGLIVLGTSLYGFYKGVNSTTTTSTSTSVTQSTATSTVVTFAIPGGFVLTPTQAEAGVYGLIIAVGGSISPTTFHGVTVTQMYTDNGVGTTVISFSGSRAQDFFTSVTIGATTLLSATADAFFESGGSTWWRWDAGAFLVTSLGSKNGNWV